jgi:hypothetical protein
MGAGSPHAGYCVCFNGSYHCIRIQEAIKEKLEQQRKAREAARRGEPAEKPRTALDRFASKDKA